MQNFVGYDVLAEETLTNLFHSNRDLLKLMITYEEINEFLTQRKNNQDQKYLKYLTDLCICNDEVVPDVQDYICKSVLQNTSNSTILILTK